MWSTWQRLYEITVGVSWYTQQNSKKYIPRLFKSDGFIREQVPDLRAVKTWVEYIVNRY